MKQIFEKFSISSNFLKFKNETNLQKIELKNSNYQNMKQIFEKFSISSNFPKFKNETNLQIRNLQNNPTKNIQIIQIIKFFKQISRLAKLQPIMRENPNHFEESVKLCSKSLKRKRPVAGTVILHY